MSGWRGHIGVLADGAAEDRRIFAYSATAGFPDPEGRLPHRRRRAYPSKQLKGCSVGFGVDVTGADGPVRERASYWFLSATPWALPPAAHPPAAHSEHEVRAAAKGLLAPRRILDVIADFERRQGGEPLIR